MHECSECGKHFHGKYEMERHKLSIHSSGDEKLFICGKCGKGFSRIYNLRNHVRNNHSVKFCESENRQNSQLSLPSKSSESITSLPPTSGEKVLYIFKIFIKNKIMIFILKMAAPII